MKARMPILLSWLLLLLAACDGGRRQQMEALLDRADSLNRAYIPMTGGLDSLLSEAASYYDRHGSPNEQLRAHYLLGCAYRDMGDAPQALQCYQDAVDRADTLASDCDYHRLMAVYGQMEDLFHLQYLPEDELKAQEEYGKLAIKTNDTLLYLYNLEAKAKPLFLLGDTIRMVEAMNEARIQYEKYGYPQNALRAIGPMIHILIQRGQLSDARHLMNAYELESGLFENGRISKGREIYYDFKGNYYLKTGQVDSAEFYFRRLQSCGYNVDASRGLLFVYRQRHDADSVYKYSLLYEKALDEQSNSRRTEVIHQMNSLYNYQQQQKKANEKTLLLAQAKAERNGYGLLFFIVLAILVCVLYTLHVLKSKKEKMLQDYLDNLAALKKTQSELEALRQHEHEYEEIIAEKKSQIALLYKKLNKRPSSEALLKETSVYKRIHFLANAGKAPSQKEWDDICSVVKEFLPGFHDFMSAHEHDLNTNEYRTCLLTRFHVKPKPIGFMLGVTTGYISRIRGNLVEKLFKVKGKSSSFDKYITAIS